MSPSSEDYRVIAKALRHERASRIYAWVRNDQEFKRGVLVQLRRLELWALDQAKNA